MGFRFRKSKQIIPGVRLNLGKKGIGLSFGGKGLRYSVNSSGRKTTTVGIPGSGISYSKTTNSKSNSKKAQKSVRFKPQITTRTQVKYYEQTQATTKNKLPTKIGAFFLWGLALLFLSVSFSLFVDKEIGAGFTALVLVAILAFLGYKKYFKAKLYSNCDLNNIAQSAHLLRDSELGDITTENISTYGMPPEQSLNTKYISAKETGNLMDLHYALNGLIEYYYTNRDTPPINADLCIKYCQEDVELFSQLHPLFMSDIGMTPRLPAFQRLAMMYDHKNQFEEAIEICDLGIKYGLEDGTQGGFAARRKRIEKKLSETITS